MGLQKLWIEKDVKDGLPEKQGLYYTKAFDEPNSCHFAEGKFYHRGGDIMEENEEVTQYLQPLTAYVLTEQQMKERDEKLASDVWDACEKYHNGAGGYNKTAPDKSQYIQSILK